MITVVCYNHKETCESRENAIKFYKTGMYCCERKVLNVEDMKYTVSVVSSDSKFQSI